MEWGEGRSDEEKNGVKREGEQGQKANRAFTGVLRKPESL